MPLEGAGRVEDTINLLGHAARKVVECVADLVGKPFRQVCVSAGIPVLTAPSIKQGLDCEWSDPEQKAEALTRLVEQLESLQQWIQRRLSAEISKPPLKDCLKVLKDVLAQDLEPDPDKPGGKRIRDGVAPERRISISDGEMRHGRKSKTKRFNGFKRHVAADIDSKLILACAVMPANRPEEEAAPELQRDIQRQNLRISELHIDRGYISAPTVARVLDAGGDVLCKPWVARNSNALFTKNDFHVDMRRLTITCPAGETESFTPGTTVEFEPETCGRCRLRSQCTMATNGGRTVSLADDERLQQRLRKLVATPRGRRLLRQRVVIEHRLAHIARRQGRRARYRGTRPNLFDLRRACAVQNLETAHYESLAAA
jgi:Transposase DDE domain